MGTNESGHFRQFFVDKTSTISGQLVPVGYAVEGTEVVLLDEAGSPVGAGEPGEIAVRSRYLALGYWRRPDLTDAAFRSDPHGGDERLYLTGDQGRMLPDGCLFHLGRQDFQVKIGGNRVEIAEIETALLSLDGVKQAVVVAREAAPSPAAPERTLAAPECAAVSSQENSEAQRGRVLDSRLVAYIVPAVPGSLTVTGLRRALAETLPAFMVPSAMVFLEALPVTGIGKVDRRALPAPESTRPDLEAAYRAPRGPLEALLAGIWQQLLGIEPVGIDDSFFDLGGNSLIATRLLMHAREIFGVEAPLPRFFEAPTIAGLAALLVCHEEVAGRTEAVARLRLHVNTLSADDVREMLQARGTAER
jgi:hypothetical protein